MTSQVQVPDLGIFAGGIQVYTLGERVSITSDNSPLPAPAALVHVVNNGAVTCGLRVTSYWTGSSISPYQNNDNSLLEVYNKVESSGTNRSWAGSFANSYNDIPAGVTDSGDRTGIIGWAVSAAAPGHLHAGTLAQQIGVLGTAGFQGSGSASTARIVQATGVRGFIYNESIGATIEDAKAGEFVTTASVGTVERNVAVYASAANGTVSNHSFFGNAGTLFNAGQILAGSDVTQASSYICARGPGNAFEFGSRNSLGFASNIGAMQGGGAPFLAFCAEADATGDTFTTRGKRGVIISSDLAGALIFSRVTASNAPGQTPVESARIDAAGRLVLLKTPSLPSFTPASSTAPGVRGEVGWDADYLYVCVAKNVWKRTSLSTW